MSRVSITAGAVAEFFNETQRRIVNHIGTRRGVQCYIAFNFIEDGKIFVRVKGPNNDGLSLSLAPTEFSWPFVATAVSKEAEDIIRDHVAWTPDLIAKTLGIEVRAQLAAE
jgi:hypothetical protein